MNIVNIIDLIVGKYAKVAAPIFIKDENSKHRIVCIGTAFLARKNDCLFLITAKHVLDNLIDGDPLIANINGQGVLLNDLYFHTSELDDLAISVLNNEFGETQNLDSVFSISLELPSREVNWLDTYILLGYPGSKNKLNENTSELDRKLFGYSTSTRLTSPSSNTHIRNPIAFLFDKKNVINSTGDKVNVGKFNGNSGGPMLQAGSFLSDSNNITISIRLAGVFIGWDKHHKEILCVSPDAVMESINKFKF